MGKPRYSHTEISCGNYGGHTKNDVVYQQFSNNFRSHDTFMWLSEMCFKTV